MPKGPGSTIAMSTPQGRDFVTQSLRIALQRVFGGGIGSEEGCRDTPDQRRGVDDQPRTCRPHSGQNGLHGSDGPEIVGLHLLLGLRDAEGLGDAQIHDAGVVDQDVHRALRQNLGKAFLNRGVAAHVHLYDGDAGRMSLQRGLLASIAPLGVPHGAPDAIAPVGEGAHSPLAKAAAGPRDDHRPDPVRRDATFRLNILLPTGTSKTESRQEIDTEWFNIERAQTPSWPPPDDGH